MNLNNKYKNRVNNILVITTTSFNFGGEGSANSNFITLLTVGLAKNNHNVHVLVQHQSKKNEGVFEGVIYKACGKFNKSNKNINTIITSIMGIIVPPIYIMKNYKYVDSTITFQNNFLESVLIVIICKIFRISIIHLQVDYYDWLFFKGSNNNWQKVIKYFNHSLRYNFLNKFNDGAIVMSSFLYNHFVKIGVNKAKVYLLTHLTDLKNFTLAQNSPILTKDKITFGVVGSLNEANGINDLLVAFEMVSKKHDNIKLLLIGGFEDEIIYCKDLVNKLGIQARVIFTGSIQYIKLSETLAACDVFVLPRPDTIYSIAGFPTKVGEYLACKRPLIITNYGDIPLYFKDKYNALLANPSDPHSLASKMLYVIENKDKALEIGEKGFEWVQETIEYISASKKISTFINSVKK